MATVAEVLSAEIAQAEQNVADLKAQYAKLQPALLQLEHTAIADFQSLWNRLFPYGSVIAPTK